MSGIAGVPAGRSLGREETADIPLSHGQPELSGQGTRNLPSPSCRGPETYCKNCHAKPAVWQPPLRSRAGGDAAALHAARGWGSSIIFFACF